MHKYHTKPSGSFQGDFHPDEKMIFDAMLRAIRRSDEFRAARFAETLARHWRRLHHEAVLLVIRDRLRVA